jgi:hypothetical protein
MQCSNKRKGKSKCNHNENQPSRSIVHCIAPRPEYVAAIRYPDGRRDLFHIRNADNLADARALVISEVGDVQSVMIALRH